MRSKTHKKKGGNTYRILGSAFVAVALIIGFTVWHSTPNGHVLGADIHAKEGGTVTNNQVTLIVSEGTFNEDVYFRVDRTTRGVPLSTDGLWQVSDFWEARVKYVSNNDQVNEYGANNNYILSFPYEESYLTTDQGIYIEPSTLKIVRGETISGPWTVMTNSVVDTTNKTVSIVTNRGGVFMVSGGFYNPKKEVSNNGAAQKNVKAIVLKPNEIIITITPTPKAVSPTPSKIPTVTHEEEVTKDEVTNLRDTQPGFFSALYSLFASLFQ